MTRSAASPHQTHTAPGRGKSQYVQFLFMKVDPAFYALLPNEKVVARQELLSLLDKYSEKLAVIPYSLVGLRADCDLLFWRVSDSLELLEEMSLRLRSVGMGKHLRPVHSLLAVASPPIYRPIQDPDENRGVVPGTMKYLFVYPFSKKPEWFQLGEAEQRRIMDEHLQIIKRHPAVKRNREYLVGLDDNDFVAAYETDDPDAFVRYIKELRRSKASSFTPRATPIFSCVRKDLGLLIESIG